MKAFRLYENGVTDSISLEDTDTELFIEDTTVGYYVSLLDALATIPKRLQQIVEEASINREYPENDESQQNVFTKAEFEEGFEKLKAEILSNKMTHYMGKGKYETFNIFDYETIEIIEPSFIDEPMMEEPEKYSE